MKDTILVEVCVKRVSIPSALLLDGEDGFGLLAMLAGSVNERRILGLEDAGGACSGVLDAAGEDMAGVIMLRQSIGCCRAVTDFS